MNQLSAETVRRMIRYFGSDVRRIHHALKVHGFAAAIAALEGLPALTQETLQLAAYLHDIGIKNAERKYNSTAGTYQEHEGPGVARELLQDLPLPAEQLERVCFLIGHHHSYGKIDGPDFQILVEADFLVNAFEDNFTADQINAVGSKYFKTATGREFLQTLFPGI